MPNLVILQDQLKNLSDQQLVHEMQMPSSAAPQFLVASELNRRKQMRQEYMAQGGGQQHGTIADDLASQFRQPGVPQMPSQQQVQSPSPALTQGIGALGPNAMRPNGAKQSVPVMQGGGPIHEGLRRDARVPVKYYDNGGQAGVGSTVPGEVYRGPYGTVAPLGSYSMRMEDANDPRAALFAQLIHEHRPDLMPTPHAAFLPEQNPVSQGIQLAELFRRSRTGYQQPAVGDNAIAHGGPVHRMADGGAPQSSIINSQYMPLIMMGLGMAGSSSPYLAQAAGQGGLAGLNLAMEQPRSQLEQTQNQLAQIGLKQARAYMNESPYGSSQSQASPSQYGAAPAASPPPPQEQGAISAFAPQGTRLAANGAIPPGIAAPPQEQGITSLPQSQQPGPPLPPMAGIPSENDLDHVQARLSRDQYELGRIARHPLMPGASGIRDSWTAQLTSDRALYTEMVKGGVYGGNDGKLHLIPGAGENKETLALYSKGMQPGARGWQYAPGVIGSEAALQGAKTAAEATNKYYDLSRPGSSLVSPTKGVIATNPYQLDVYDPNTQRMTKQFAYVQPQVHGAGGQGGAPASQSPAEGLQSRGAVGEPLAAPAQSPGGGVQLNAQGLPIYPAAPSEFEKQSQDIEATEQGKYRANLRTSAAQSVQGNYLLNQMNQEHFGWDMGRFADIQGELSAYLRAIYKALGQEPPADLSRGVANWEAFGKNGMELSRQTVRATSSRAAVQEFSMIQNALPRTTMSEPGFQQIRMQLQAANDYNIVKQQAADQWRRTHGGYLGEDFEADWNKNVGPSAFLLHRMDAKTFRQVADNLSRTPEGRATLARAIRGAAYAQQHGLFGMIPE